MQRVSSGYTIIEVLIVLAISGFLLVVSMTFLSGREAQNRFAQSMRDAQSKFQDLINDVPTGFPGGTSGLTDLSSLRCNILGNGRVQIMSTGIGATTPNCIFLGKAIQVTTAASPPVAGQESKIYAYSVFGRRTLTDVSGDERLVNNLEEAKPVPAVGIQSVSGDVDLTETYTLGGGAKVLSVTSQLVDASGATITGNSRMAGFYLTFNQLSANRNGSQDLKSYIYKFPNDVKPGNVISNVNDCISMNNGSGCEKQPVSLSDDLWPQVMKEWDICFGNVSNDETAVLTIFSSNGLGASTKLEFKACS